MSLIIGWDSVVVELCRVVVRIGGGMLSSGSIYGVVVVVDGGYGWFHTLRRGGCQAPCLTVFPLVTALPAIGLRAS